jgi:hypothetical protein
MAKKLVVPHRNRSPSGWWVFCEVQQWVPKGRAKLSPTNRCPVWENTRLVKARDRDEAYSNSMKLGRVGMPSKTFGGEWRFVGLSMLLPVYDEIEDGAEILWDDHGSISVGRIRRMVKSKRDLPVFDDREEA